MTDILKAKPVVKSIYARLKTEIEGNGISPKLVIMLVGNDPSAKYYVRNLEKKGGKVGIIVETKIFPTDISQYEMMKEIKTLDDDNEVHGIMIQKPLPAGFDEYEINYNINPLKDVDAFHPVNLGNLLLGKESFIPCTPAAVIEMLKFYDIEVTGKNVVILGRSNIVGKPLANLLLKKAKVGNATVTVCHSKTKNLSEVTRNAEILIAAIGRPKFVKAEMIKENAIVIDVGVNQINDEEKGSIYVGDVDYENCFEKASAITPVPGGVGSVTTAMLLNNVLSAYNKLKKR